MSDTTFVTTWVNLKEGYTDYHCPECPFEGRIEHTLITLDVDTSFVLTCPKCGHSRPVQVAGTDLVDKAMRQARCRP